jgi:hypothetical protein
LVVLRASTGKNPPEMNRYGHPISAQSTVDCQNVR